MAAVRLHLARLIGCSDPSCLLIQTRSSKNENASFAQKMIGRKILFSCHVSNAAMCFVKTAARMIWYCYTRSVQTQHIKCSSVGDSLISSQNPLVLAALATWCSQKVKSLLLSSGIWSNLLTRKASPFGRCLTCAREGNEVLLCPLCLRPDGRRLQQSHASIHVDISHVQVRCKKYKNKPCVACSACNNGEISLTSNWLTSNLIVLRL